MSVHCSCVTTAPSGVEVGCALVVDAKAVMCACPYLQSFHSSPCRCVSCLSIQKILIVLLLFAFRIVDGSGRCNVSRAIRI